MRVRSLSRLQALFALPVAAAMLLSACRSSDNFRRYDLDGKIISVDAAKKKLVIAHKDVPGLMKAMTMDYKVNDDWVFRRAKPGDHITASLVLDPEGAYLEKVTLTSTGTPVD